MESFYELAFPDVSFKSKGDTTVRCPFPHKANGVEYYEDSPSLLINLTEDMHHCFGCHVKGNNMDFMTQYLGITPAQAYDLKNLLDKSEDIISFDHALQNIKLNNTLEKVEHDLKFSKEAIEILNLGVEVAGKGLAFPVILFNKLVDVITYNPAIKPKYKKRIGVPNGFIMPYDHWKEQTKGTLIVAGQKDLGIALTHGFNAITITGGEGTIPELFLNDFKDKIVNIVYDNDDAGTKGALKVASRLHPYAKRIKIIDISETCVEKGEDLWDYFVKYNKTREDFVKLVKDTEPFNLDEHPEIKEEIQAKVVTLSQAIHEGMSGRLLKSNIQVIGSSPEKYDLETSFVFEKHKDATADDGQLAAGEKKIWTFNPQKAKDIFYLVDQNLTEQQIFKNKLALLRIPPKEKRFSVKTLETQPVYKAVVSDYFEAVDGIANNVEEYDVYSIGKPLTSGKTYQITYRIVPHPTKGRLLILVVFDVEESQDSVSSFIVNDDVKQALSKFQVKTNLTETIDSHIEKINSFVNAKYDPTLMKIIDFWYHTPLQFDIGTRKALRAYLDVIIVGESRIGKSTGAQALLKLYGLGTRIPLAGSNATASGIIGGSRQTRTGFQTTAGALPRANKGAVIFEELMKAKEDLLTHLTDVRSSHEVTVTRVAGAIKMPAFVRMLTLTNAKSIKDGSNVPRPISSYPNGIEVLTELIGTPEDIARYDIAAVLGTRGPDSLDPFYTPPKPFEVDEYRTRIRWVWSRQPHQIHVSKEVYTYTVQCANEINKDFDSYIKIFGTEAWLKIIRLAVAIAGYVASTDETYENIVVHKEHIDYAIGLLLSLYDNPVFRFREYVKQERQFSTVTDEDIKILQNLWSDSMYTKLIHSLENSSKINSRSLQTASGLENSDYNVAIAQLVSSNFLRLTQNDVIPAEKFRLALNKIDRKTKGVMTIAKH